MLFHVIPEVKNNRLTFVTTGNHRKDEEEDENGDRTSIGTGGGNFILSDFNQ
jgi:hypothetical protein